MGIIGIAAVYATKAKDDEIPRNSVEEMNGNPTHGILRKRKDRSGRADKREGLGNAFKNVLDKAKEELDKLKDASVSTDAETNL